MELTRRKMLAGIGGGTLAVGGVSLGQRTPRFARYTYAAATDDTSDGRLRVAWYETYNGAFQENQGGTTDGIDATLDPETTPAYVREASYVTDGSGPVVSVGNVLPGDSGTLVVGVEVLDDDAAEEFDAEALDVWFQGRIVENAENGVNGPERAAGDVSPDTGELATSTRIEVWRDGSPLGTCNGRKEFDEQLESALVARTSFADAFAETAPAGSPDGVLALSCLDPGALRCVALAWDLPATVGNLAQGDSLGFEFSFAAAPCGSDSPFRTGGTHPSQFGGSR